MDTASRMARAREQGFDVDTRYYHGTPYAQGVADEGFSPRFLGKGHDEYGPGFYFSDDPRLASGYARETRAKGDGREVSPGMIEAFLRSNPLQIIREGDKSTSGVFPTGIPLKLTQESAEKLIEKAPGVRDADGPLSNFFEPSSPEGYTQSDISKVAREYAGDDADYLLNDLYRGDAQSFLDALTDTTGIDSVDVLFPEFPLSSVKTVFRPDQIRSPYAAFDPDQRNSPNIMAGVGAAAVGAGLLAAPQESEAGVLGSVLKPVAGQRISTRYPTAKAATEDPLAENLIINTDAMRVSPKAFDTNAAIVGGYNTTRTGAKSAEGRTRAFIDEAADNLLYIFDNVRPEVRDVSRQWYVGANRIANELSEKYGVTVETASGVLAALSPQKDWYQNASLAERVLSVYRNGTNAPLPGEAIETARRIYGKPQYAEDLKAVETKPFEALTDSQKAMFIRSYDQTFNPRGYDIISPTGERVGPATTKAGKPGTTAWGSNSEIAKAIRVIENPTIENISAQMGQQHKVRNFYNNIVDPMYAQNNPSIGDITADTHAVAADLMKPLGGSALEVTHNFGGAGSASSALSGAQGTYGMHADAYRKAAAEAGVMPREMQSITWEAVRGLFPASFKTKGNVADIDGVWNLYSKGKISKDAARDLILEKAGGMDDPDWVIRPDSGIALPAGAASDKGVLSEPRVSRSGGVDSRTRFIAAGMPAEWLGLGGAGAGAAGAVIRNPDGSSRQMTAMEQAMYEESQARIQPLIDAMAPDPGFTYGDLLPVKRMDDPAARAADTFGGFRPAIPNLLRDTASNVLRVGEGARTGMLDERALQEILF